MNPRKITKLLCRVLRHKPADLGLHKGDLVFSVEDVINGLQRYRSIFLTREQLYAIVKDDPQRRIIIENGAIFAPFGCSSVISPDLGVRSYYALGRKSGNFWLPLRTSKWNELKKHSFLFFGRTQRFFSLYPTPEAASSKAACWHRSDTPLIVLMEVEGYMFNKKLYTSRVDMCDVKEVRQVVPAFGKTWEESRFTNNWSYSIIDAGMQRK